MVSVRSFTGFHVIVVKVEVKVMLTHVTLPDLVPEVSNLLCIKRS